MANENSLKCDGCGQAASAEHVARRLQRLEWTTRYRPIHIATLLLGAASPEADAEFLYAPEMKFQGESKAVLEAVGVHADGKPVEDALTEFQRGGFFLAHVIECAVEAGGRDPDTTTKLLEQRLPFAIARIRRSLKPKRVALISSALDPLIRQIESANLGCPLVLDRGKAFALDTEPQAAKLRLREALTVAAAAR